MKHPQIVTSQIRQRKRFVILHFVFLFFATVQFTHPAGISPYPILYFSLFSIGMFVAINQNFSIKQKEITLPLLLLVYGIGVQFQSDLGGFNLILLFILALLTAFLYARILVSYMNAEFFRALEIFLWVSSIALFLQIFLNILGVGYVDVHNLLFPWSYGKGAEMSFGIARYTGIYQEPGQHSTVIASLLLVTISNTKTQKPVHFIALLSCALTFATIGLIYFAGISALLLIRAVKIKLSNLLKIGAFFSTSFYAVWAYGAETYLKMRFIEREEDASLAGRLENYQIWMDWSFFERMMGRGLAATQSPEFTSLQGSGFLFSSTVSFGMLWFPLLILSSILFSRRGTNLLGAIIIAGFLSISRFPPTFVFPYFLIFVATMRPKVTT